MRRLNDHLLLNVLDVGLKEGERIEFQKVLQ